MARKLTSAQMDRDIAVAIAGARPVTNAGASADPFRHTGKQGTMRYFMWKSAVLTEAKVSEKDAHEYAGRERLHAWFRAGEPVWMAADALRQFVKNGKREARADREATSLRAMLKIR